MIKVPTTGSKLRKNIVEVPEVVNSRSGIRVFGQWPKSFLFGRDVAIIRTIEAGANAISSGPPAPEKLFKDTLLKYRSE
jgi:hypothetical protein